MKKPISCPKLMLLAAAACALAPSLASAALHGTSGSATFGAAGPAGLRIEGKTSDVAVSEGEGNVKVTVALASLDTGIDLRNHHMRDKYLEVPKYPTATLVVPRASLQYPKEGQDSAASADGTMTLHGVSKSVTFAYRAHRTHDGYDVTGTTHLNMKEFGVVVPSYLGITVRPDVDLSVHFVAQDA